MRTSFLSNVFHVLTIILLVPATAFTQGEIHITDGVCDARKVNLKDRRLQLNGRWKFYPNALLTPAEVSWDEGTTIAVPSLWDKGSGINYGTYALRILLSPNESEFALEVPQLYNSYRLFINDTLVAFNGVPAETKESTIPAWRPQPVAFTVVRDTNIVVLQVAGFHHSKSGIREPIFIGTQSTVISHFNSTLISTVVEGVIVTVLSLTFFIIWFRKKNQTVSLHFAVFCLAWGVREFFSDVYPISTFFPEINWNMLVRIEYLTLFVLMSFAVLFLNGLFAEVSSTLFKYMTVFLNGVFGILTLATPVEVFSRWLPLYLALAAVIIIYAGVTVIRALIRDTPGAWPLIAGILLLMFTMGYDLVAYNGTVMSQVLVGNIGYCLIYLCCAVGLLQHLGFIQGGGHSDNTLSYKDLYK